MNRGWAARSPSHTISGADSDRSRSTNLEHLVQDVAAEERLRLVLSDYPAVAYLGSQGALVHASRWAASFRSRSSPEPLREVHLSARSRFVHQRLLPTDSDTFQLASSLVTRVPRCPGLPTPESTLTRAAGGRVTPQHFQHAYP
jgi:hypothetical protein